jgi:hypothetical protein
MNRFDHQWQKLTALARLAGDTRDTAAPYGFATRVTGLAAATPAFNPRALFERFALRGLVVAAALGMAAIVLSYSTITTEATDAYAASDTVGELLDLS